MRYFKFLFVLTLVFLVACNVNQKKESSRNCFDGIGAVKGDTPVVNYTFSNGKSLVVCGFKESLANGIISEFNVFDCDTEESLVEYGALKNCKIVDKTDTLQIDEYKWLPANNNFEFRFIKIGEQYLTLQAGKVVVSERTPAFARIDINQDTVDVFIKSLVNAKSDIEDWETNILFLETLALNGSEEATNALNNLESLTGQTFDGAVLETLLDARTTMEWLQSH